MSDQANRLVAPGPSYLRELELEPGSHVKVGMSQPQTMADGWWVTLIWADEDGRVPPFAVVSPTPEPPPGSPLLRLGPALAGTMSGLITEEGGRQQLRLRLGQPPQDESRPWEAPLTVLAAIRFEPARVATMRDNEVALTVLKAFRDALVRISR